MTKVGVPEWVKDVLIVLLSLSALWLVSRSPFYVGSPLQERMRALVSTTEEVTPEPVSLTAAARPFRIAVVNSDGRYGVQYDRAELDSLFDEMGGILGEALGTAGEPFPVTELRWQTALQKIGVYFDFANAIPLSILADWLWSGTANVDLSAEARRICLSTGQEEEEVWLFWQDESSDSFYACETGLRLSLHLRPSVAMMVPNGAIFAFEDTAYKDCDPYTLIAGSTAPVVYEAATPISAEDSGEVTQVLTALSYAAASGSSYPTSGGTRYTDGDNTYLLTNPGTLSYRAEAKEPDVSKSSGTVTLGKSIETTRLMTEDTLGALCGEARVTLISVQDSGDRQVITYGYSLNGIPVSLYDDGWAARYVVEDGTVIEFVLHFRSYTATEATTLLLPELQAAAGMADLNAEGKELWLSYQDTGSQQVSAGWVAR